MELNQVERPLSIRLNLVFSQLNLARSCPATPELRLQLRLNFAEKYLHGRDAFYTAFLVENAEINIHWRELQSSLTLIFIGATKFLSFKRTLLSVYLLLFAGLRREK